MAEARIPLKILVDKARNKVLFAEADASFVKILFSFLTMPMGTIVRLVGENSDSKVPSIGSFNTLYEGLVNLPSECFWTDEGKTMLLHPRNSSQGYCSQLKLIVDDSMRSKYFICEGTGSSSRSYCSNYYSMCNSVKCNCGKLLNREISLRMFGEYVDVDYGKGNIFANEAATFIITDDLLIKPSLPGSSIQLLNDLVTKDVTDFEEMTMTVGKQEVLNLLRFALFSGNPLTNLFLGKKQTIWEFGRWEPGNTSRPQVKKEAPASGNGSNLKKFDVKAFVRKSDGKLLFVLSGGDFVDFLFSFLVIPLGTMDWLLSGTNIPPSIDNLYTSLSNLDVGKYIKSQGLKDMLLQPPLPQKYLCKNQIFNLKEVDSWDCFQNISSGTIGYVSSPPAQWGAYTCLTLKDPKWKGEFVRGTSTFMVTDDLVVTPFSSISICTYFLKLNVPLCEVEEREFSIGMEEGLSILKASLTSSAALSSVIKDIPTAYTPATEVVIAAPTNINPWEPAAVQAPPNRVRNNGWGVGAPPNQVLDNVNVWGAPRNQVRSNGSAWQR